MNDPACQQNRGVFLKTEVQVKHTETRDKEEAFGNETKLLFSCNTDIF